MAGGTGLNRGKSASREDAYQLSICGRIAEFQAQRPPMQIAATPRTTASTFSEAERRSIRPLPRKGLRGRLRSSRGKRIIVHSVGPLEPENEHAETGQRENERYEH